jgi:hypothetical protein
MSKSLTYIVCLGILLAGYHPLSAQDMPSVKASVDKNQILIGEPFLFRIDVKSPMVSGNQLPQFDSLPHFELIEKGSRDSVISADGASYHLEWKLTSFDSGTRVIPSFSFTMGKQVYKSDSLAVEVSYGKIDTAQDYHDIKGIIDIENPNVKYIPWVLGAVTALALMLFVWFIRFPFPVVRQPPAVPVSQTSPLDEALVSLEHLKNMLRNDPSSVKKYYSGMNDTLRIFLNRRLGLITMEKTSGELIMSLSNIQMDRDVFSKLAAALRLGDFVKFAKYIPGPNENANNLEVIRSAIVFINETGK